MIDVTNNFSNQIRTDEIERIIIRVKMISLPGPLTVYTVEEHPRIFTYSDTTQLDSDRILKDVLNGSSDQLKSGDYLTTINMIVNDRLTEDPFLLIGLVSGGDSSTDFDGIKFSLNKLYNSGPTRAIFLGVSQNTIPEKSKTVLSCWKDVFKEISAIDLNTFPMDGRGYYLNSSLDLSSDILLFPTNTSRRVGPVELKIPETVQLKATERSKVNIVVMLDISGSFRSFLPQAKETLKELVVSLREGDFITILTVDDSVDVVISQEIKDPVRDIIHIRDLIDPVKVSRDRGTDIVSGFTWSVNYLQNNDLGNSQGKILVCVTDGEPDFHPLSLQNAEGWVAPEVLQDTEIYLIGYNMEMKELSMHTLIHNQNLDCSESPLSDFDTLLDNFREELTARPNISKGGE